LKASISAAGDAIDYPIFILPTDDAVCVLTITLEKTALARGLND